MTSRPALRFLLVDVVYPAVAIALIVAVIAEIRGQTWRDAAGYGIGLLAFHLLMLPVHRRRRHRTRHDGAPAEAFDLVHYRPASKRETSR